MNLLRKAFYFLIYTNLLIGLAAAAQTALTYSLLAVPVDLYVVGIEGFATLLLYNFSLLLAKPKSPQTSPFQRTRWVYRNEWLLWLNSGLAALLLLYCLFYIHFYSFLFLGGIGLLSILYALPFIPYRGERVGLRQIPGMKVFHIAMVWTFSSVCFPALEIYLSGGDFDMRVFLMLVFLKFIFILICTLPFDIRDMKQDSFYHLRTIPNIVGLRSAKLLCYVLLVLHSAGVLSSCLREELQAGLLLTNISIALLLRFLIFRSGEQHYHYAYLLDFALVLQFVFVAAVVRAVQ